MTSQTDVKVEFIMDTTAASADYVAEVTAPTETTTPPWNITLETTGTSFSNGSARQLTFTSSGTATEINTVTVTGTDSSNRSITEDVELPISGALATSTNYFKTITSAVGAPPTVITETTWPRSVSIGMSSNALQSLPFRTRLKGYSIANGNINGPIFFFSGVPNASTGALSPLSFQAFGYATGNVMSNFTIPGEGILYEDGVTVTYAISTAGAPVRMMNLYYG